MSQSTQHGFNDHAFARNVSAITYGPTLASSTLSRGLASIGGSFAWTMPTTKPAAGTASYSVTFTTADTADYGTATSTVSLQVNKAVPTITTAPTASSITYGQTLASSTLSRGLASIGRQLRMDDADDRTGGGHAPTR